MANLAICDRIDLQPYCHVQFSVAHSQAATVWRHLANICSREMRGVILGSIAGLWLVMPAEAASITVNAPDAHGRIFVDVVGEIVAADEQAFEQKVAILHSHADKVIVTLSGPGRCGIARNEDRRTHS